ncbi:hypothetical protein DFH28DRAFT_1056749 [Melampsora americana]|nr:hypothetical protein DFH28DRAFT_1056749 [Melampsora americana]
MDKKLLSLGWYFIYLLRCVTLTPSEQIIDAVAEGSFVDGMGGGQRGQELQIHTSSPPQQVHQLGREFENEIPNGSVDQDGQLMELPDEIQAYLKLCETFEPLNEGFKYVKNETKERNGMSSVVHKIQKKLTLAKGMKKIHKICRDSHFNSFAQELLVMIDELYSGSQTFKSETLEKIVIQVLEYLQVLDLGLYQRLWTLRILKIIQSILPIGSIKKIRQDPNTGIVCRGGLELFLLEADAVNPILAVVEALQRVRLMITIQFCYHYYKRTHQTPRIMNIHDQLLLNKSLSNTGILESLASQAMDYNFDRDSLEVEIKCFYEIMKHLDTFYPITKDLGITEALKKIELNLKIKRYLQECKKDYQTPIMMNIYHNLLQAKSLDKAKIVKSLALEFLQQMSLETNSDDKISFLHYTFQYLEALHPSSQQLAITEPLTRVELIMKIRKCLHSTEKIHPTARITELHNKLIQTRSLGNTEFIEKLTLECMDHMVLEDTSDEEIECCYHTLEYLESFHPIAKQLVSPWLETDQSFRMIALRCQNGLQPQLQVYSKNKDKDPYIMSLLMPFVGLHLVDLAYVKWCIHVLNIQDSALASGRGKLYGLDVTQASRYHGDQDLFINIMYKASPSVKGLEHYLNDHVKRNSKHIFIFRKNTPSTP